jgi:hypothetical protein
MKTVLLAVLVVAAAVPAQAAKRKKKPAVRADSAKAKATPAAATPAVTPVAAPVAAPAGPPRDDAALGGFGAVLCEDADGLLAAEPRPGSAAAALGLRAGDRAWRVDRAAPRTRAEAAGARRSEAPEARESLVIRRGLETAALQGESAASPADFTRGATDLSARERALGDARAARDAAQARDAVAESAPLDWTLRADQAVWVRFPGGLPADLTAGAVVEAEAATGLTTDGSLDFLAVPPKSRLSARVVSASDDGAVRRVRLAFYKLRLVGGRTYPILGAATALAGVPAADLARVSSGGTLVIAAPLPPADGKKPRGKPLLLDEEARVRVRVLEPVTVVEPRSWWRAGPGLWLKTAADANGKRRFQVTHVVAGRSAASAGLKVGDLLDSVGGRSSERMDFEEALDSLYGAPGSAVKVSVSGAAGSRALELARGVKSDGKTVVPLSLPVE